MADLLTTTVLNTALQRTLSDSDGSRPTATQAALMANWAEGLYRGLMRIATSTALTDTYGLLTPILVMIFLRFVNNARAITNPDAYQVENELLMPHEERMLRIASGSYQFYSFEIGEPAHE